MPTEAELLIETGPAGTASDPIETRDTEHETFQRDTAPRTEDTREVDLDSFRRIAQPTEQLREEEEAAAKEDEKGEDNLQQEKEVAVEDTPSVRPTAKKFLEAKAKETPQVTEEVFTEAEAGFLKKMSNDAREFVTARMKELKQSKKELEEHKTKIKTLETEKQSLRPFDHKLGYLLEPEYQEAVVRTQQLNPILQHYKAQLIKLEKGEEWEDLVQSADGKITRVTREPTTEAKIAIQERVAEGNLMLRQHHQNAQSIISRYAAGYNGLRDGLKTMEDDFFPQYTNEEEFSKNEDVKEIQEILNQRGLTNNVLSPLTTKIYAWAMDMYRENEELKKAQTKEKELATIKKKVQPSSKDLRSGGSSSGGDVPFNPNVYNKEAFERLREGLA